MLPDQLTMTNKKRVPVYSILLAFVVGVIFFLPFPSWSKLVGARHLGDRDHVRLRAGVAGRAAPERPDRPRPYRLPFAEGHVPGRVLRRQPDHLLERLRRHVEAAGGDLRRPGAVRDRAAPRDDADRTDIDWRAASWIWPVADRPHGDRPARPLRRTATTLLPDWVDLGVVVVFSLVIFYYAVEFRMKDSAVQRALASEDWQLPGSPDVNLAP